jgi:hypothetical protein
MSPYEPDVPKAAVACVAAAVTALTIGAFVAAPAVLGVGYDPAAALAAKPATEVAISPARIDVVAVRIPDVAWALPDSDKRNCKPEG